MFYKQNCTPWNRKVDFIYVYKQNCTEWNRKVDFICGFINKIVHNDMAHSIFTWFLTKIAYRKIVKLIFYWFYMQNCTQWNRKVDFIVGFITKIAPNEMAMLRKRADRQSEHQDCCWRQAHTIGTLDRTLTAASLFARQKTTLVMESLATMAFFY